MITIIRKSKLTGNIATMDIDITEDQLNEYFTSDVLIQNAFPHLTPGEREFIINGITPKEWVEYFGDGDDDGESQIG